MRFAADSYTASTWELDGEHGNKIPGSEEQIRSDLSNHGLHTHDGNHMWAAVSEAMEERAKRTSEDRYVLAEVWNVDSKRPAAEFLSSYRRRG